MNRYEEDDFAERIKNSGAHHLLVSKYEILQTESFLMKKIFFLIVILLSISQAQGRQTYIHKLKGINSDLGSPGYPVPIQPENMWVYEDPWGIDSLRISKNTILLKGNIFYQIIEDGYPSQQFIRFDSSGYYECWCKSFFDSLTVRYYKPHAAIGDTWKYPTPYDVGGFITHTQW
jgi:hypothetical protein